MINIRKKETSIHTHIHTYTHHTRTHTHTHTHTYIYIYIYLPPNPANTHTIVYTTKNRMPTQTHTAGRAEEHSSDSRARKQMEPAINANSNYDPPKCCAAVLLSMLYYIYDEKWTTI